MKASLKIFDVRIHNTYVRSCSKILWIKDFLTCIINTSTENLHINKLFYKSIVTIIF